MCGTGKSNRGKPRAKEDRIIPMIHITQVFLTNSGEDSVLTGQETKSGRYDSSKTRSFIHKASSSLIKTEDQISSLSTVSAVRYHRINI